MQENNLAKSLAIISFIFMGIVAAFNFSPHVEKPFVADGFYTSEIGTRSDPRELYAKMYNKAPLNASRCETVAFLSQSCKFVNNNTYWVAEHDIPTTKEKIDAVSLKDEKSESTYEYYPFKNGDNIIAPSNLTFTNSNISQEKVDSITIEGMLGTGYLIKFEDVDRWFCHIGKDATKEHTEVVGKGGKSKSVGGGAIIGIAKDTTKVTIYEEGGINLLNKPTDLCRFYFPDILEE